MSKYDTYTLLAHGDRNVEKHIKSRTKLTNENMFYIVYTHYGLPLKQIMTPIIKMVLKCKNTELKAYFQNEKNFTKNNKVIPFETMKFYVIQLFNIVIDNLIEESQKDIVFKYNYDGEWHKYNISKYRSIVDGEFNELLENDYIYMEFIMYIINSSTLDEKFNDEDNINKKSIIINILFLFKFADIFKYVLFENDYTSFNEEINNNSTQYKQSVNKKHKNINEYFIFLLEYIRDNIDKILSLDFNDLNRTDYWLDNDINKFYSKINEYLKINHIFDTEVSELISYQKLYTKKDKHTKKRTVSLPFYGTNQFISQGYMGVSFHNLNVLHVIILTSHMNVKVYNSNFKKKSIPNINIGIIGDFKISSIVKKYIETMKYSFTNNNNNNNTKHNQHNISKIKENHNSISKKILADYKDDYIDSYIRYVYKTGLYSINDNTALTKITYFTPNKNYFPNDDSFHNDNCVINNKLNIFCLAYFLYLNNINKLQEKELLNFIKLVYNSNTKNKDINKKINNINSKIYNCKQLKEVINTFEENIKPSKPTFLHIVCCTRFRYINDIKINKYMLKVGYETNENNVESLSTSNKTKRIPTITITNTNTNTTNVIAPSKGGRRKSVKKSYSTYKRTFKNIYKNYKQYKTRKLNKHH